MPERRILVTGASGSGTSTLGRGLATVLASQAFDADDFFWVPGDPPFAERRSVVERVRLMQEVFLPRRDWILSGSVLGWSEAVVPRLTAVIFVRLDPGVRLARLRQRERLRLGELSHLSAVERAEYDGFMDWASQYDDPEFTGRNISRHRAFLADLPCPVVEVDSGGTLAQVLALARERLDALTGAS